jgi:hypothetical protein
MIKNTAAFWIASGKYIAEADCSARSLAKHMPDVSRILFTPDENYYVTNFDMTEKLPKRAYDNWFLDSVRYTGYALEHIQQSRVINLDSDTIVLKPFPEVFEMLFRFNLIGCQSKTKGQTQFYVPDCFPEIDIGFVGYQNNIGTIKFIKDWWKLFEEYENIYKEDDQPSLREALWQYSLYDDNFRYYALPNKYHQRVGIDDPYDLNCVILHGRS